MTTNQLKVELCKLDIALPDIAEVAASRTCSTILMLATTRGCFDLSPAAPSCPGRLNAEAEHAFVKNGEPGSAILRERKRGRDDRLERVRPHPDAMLARGNA